LKHPAAYYLLLLYITVLCRPVVPFLQDVLAHTLYEQVHLTAVHHHGEASHVQREMGSLSQEENTANRPAKIKTQEEVLPHIASGYQLVNLLCFSPGSIKNAFVLTYFPAVVLAIQLPPPRL
jgi:hypothetical protein